MGEASEMSSMSEMSQVSEMSSVSGGGAAASDDDKKKKMLLIFGSGLCLLLVGGALIGIALSASGAGAEGSGGGGSGSGDSDDPDYIVPSPSVGPPAPPPPPATTTTTTPRPRNLTLLCTVGKYALVERQFPPDALCDFLFYTHVFYDSSTDRFVSYSQKSFLLFKAQLANYRHTQSGISVDEKYVGALEHDLLSTKGKLEFKRLLDSRIVHHGVLSATGDPTPVLKALQVLRAAQLQFNSAQTKKNLIVLGLRGEYGKTATFGSWMAKAKNAPYDIIILHTHVTRWDLYKMMGTSGASIWDSKDHKYCSMTQALQELQPSNFPAAPRNPTFMLSVTFGVYTFFAPKEGWSDKGRGIHDKKLAQSFGLSDYSEVCERGNGRKVLPERFMVKAVDPTFQLIYDTNETLIEKMGLAMAEVEKKKGLPSQGWAIFDVELDDTDKMCNYTRGTGHDRLLEIKNYLDSLPP